MLFDPLSLSAVLSPVHRVGLDLTDLVDFTEEHLLVLKLPSFNRYFT